MDKITALDPPCLGCQRKAKAATVYCHAICPDFKIYEAKRRKYRSDMDAINKEEHYDNHREDAKIRFMRKKMNRRSFRK